MSKDIKSRSQSGFGWKPDLPDKRDFKFSLPKKLPKLKSVYLFDRFNTPPIYDQGRLGSCVGNGVAALVQFALMNKGTNHPTSDLFFPSRLFIYYYARAIEGSINVDAGASIRDGIKVINSLGVPSEKKWPYDISQFSVQPSQAALDEALKFESLEYLRIDNTKKADIVGALLQGHPVVFGFAVYDSFESGDVAQTGVVPYPADSEQFLGGHCCVIWGYNADKDYFLCRNSWGPNWGKNGYFQMPAKYITSEWLADDFWIIKSMKAA